MGEGKRILSVGMMVCDTLLSPVPHDVLMRDSMAICPPVVCCGGDALNTAIGCGKLGCRISIAGLIGKDGNGQFLLDQCRLHHVDTEAVVMDEGFSTACSYALIDESGERHFLSEISIFHELSGTHISDEAIKKADIVYFGSLMAHDKMNRGGLYDLFSRAHSYGKLTVMDAAVNWNDTDHDWFAYFDDCFRETDIFFPSLTEAKMLTGREAPEEIAECFRHYDMKLFGIKLGDQGCFMTDFKEIRYIPGISNVPVVDTTGAGDSFMAGLLCGLSRGWELERCVKFASCVAALNIGAYGGTAGIPSFEKGIEFYKKVNHQEESEEIL